MLKPKPPSGYSLLEGSIVLLVIALIVAGAISSSRLVNYMLLATAREVTSNTSITYMRRDIIAWFDSTSEDSFIMDEAVDGFSVSNWYETRPYTLGPANAWQAVIGKQPIYVSKAINGIPALEFDGVDDMMTITANYTDSLGKPPFYNDFSVVVLARAMKEISVVTEADSGTDGQTGQAYALFPPSGDTTYPALAETSSAGISFGTNAVNFFENSDSYTPAIMASPIGYAGPVIILMEYRDGTPRFWLNGRLVRTGLTSSKEFIFPPFHIGGGPSPWESYGNFHGYIGEIIIIDRALMNDERKDIFKYLRRKWKLRFNYAID